MTWQPIETAPKDGTSVIAIEYPTTNQPVVLFFGKSCEESAETSEITWRVAWDHAVYKTPTHWTPVPEMPI